MIMDNFYKDLLLICVFSIPISLIWFGIHYFLIRKEKNGSVLSAKQKEWMVVSKIAGYFFLLSPLFIFTFFVIEDRFHVFENILGFCIAIFIALVVILPSLLRKGKF